MRKNNWGEDRVLYYNAQGRLCSVLASWTSLALQDAFSLASAGRSWFRVDDEGVYLNVPKVAVSCG